MICAKCGQTFRACKCVDIDARLREVRRSATRVELRWCNNCDRHADRCVCSFTDYLRRQAEWSARTFGHGVRTVGLTRHIEKEIAEIRLKPHDLTEWVDVMILALDGYWRAGGDPAGIMADLQAKQNINFARQWDRRSDDEPTEHVR
jgi:hypothetical protein